MRRITDEVWIDNLGNLGFSKKYVATGFFDQQIDREYYYGEQMEGLTWVELQTQAEGGIIWGYSDTGFSLKAEKIDSEESFTAFMKMIRKNRPAQIRFYVKKSPL